MELVTEKQGIVVVVKVKGRMDALTAPDFEKKCLFWLQQGESKLAVDLGELEYLSSAGVRAILIVARKFKSVDGSICFCRVKKMVKNVFLLSGLTSMFPVYESLEEALARDPG